jgi:hypothetical protein
LLTTDGYRGTANHRIHRAQEFALLFNRLNIRNINVFAWICQAGIEAGIEMDAGFVASLGAEAVEVVCRIGAVISGAEEGASEQVVEEGCRVKTRRNGDLTKSTQSDFCLDMQKHRPYILENQYSSA